MPASHVWRSTRTIDEVQDLLLGQAALFRPRRPGLDTPLARIPFAFIDVETTGLLPEQGDRVVEIAALRVEPGGEETRFLELLNPERDVPEQARRLHALRPRQLSRCRTYPAAAPALERILDGAVWVGHNVGFDIGFLRAESARAGRTLHPAWALDTLLLSRRWLSLRRNSLDAVAEHLGIRKRSPHRALDDLLTTKEVLTLLISRIDPSPETLEDLLRAMLPMERGGA